MANGGKQEFVDYIVPPKKVWFKSWNPEEQKIKSSGTDGSLTYAGYQAIGTMTILVFDRIKEAGKKTTAERFSINAASVLYMGVMEPRD